MVKLTDPRPEYQKLYESFASKLNELVEEHEQLHMSDKIGLLEMLKFHIMSNERDRQNSKKMMEAIAKAAEAAAKEEEDDEA